MFSPKSPEPPSSAVGTMERTPPATRVPAQLKRVWTDERVRSALIAGLVAFAIYEVSREPGPQNYNQYVRLADSLLHGRVDLEPAPWLELVTFEGRAYSHQGLLPAVLLMPFVLVFGSDFNLRHFAALLGGGISVAAWSLATRIGLDGWRRIAGWAFPVLGTTLWFEAKAGSTWGVAALASALFLFLSLNEYFGKRRLWLIGLFVGLAAMSRPPSLLALGGYAIVVRFRFRELVELGLGAVGPVVLILLYNVLRFGTVIDRSQELHYAADNYRHSRPPGQFSFAHIPQNLHSWFFLGPQFEQKFPYVKLTIMGTALPLTSPAFLSALGAKRERWLWIGALLVVTPAALHYANGFAQFGMRYLLDAIPFLTALIFLALKDGRAPGYLALLAASIAINAYGVAYTTVYGLQP
jgi:hypothetical protein